MKKKSNFLLYVVVIILIIILAIVFLFRKTSVESINFDFDSVTIYTGQAVNLPMTISPSNADNRNIIWESSNERIATVNNGLIVGIDEGETIITASTIDRSVSSSCHIIVKVVEVERIDLSVTNVSLKVGEISQVIGAVDPVNAKYQALTYQSNDPSIATVDDNGIITGIGPGTTQIVVTDERNKAEAICNVTVNKKIEKIELERIVLDKTEIELNVGKDETIKATLIPADAEDVFISWTSSNPGVATVKDGIVHGLSQGEATITVKSNGQEMASCKVVVVRKVSLVTLNKKSMSISVGNTEQLKATVLPSGAQNKKVTWTSSNPKVATVDSTGKVKGVKEGITVIIVKTDDGGKRATCVVTVKRAAYKPIVPSNPFVKYESATLRYYIQNNDTFYLTYIWMEDPANQIRKLDPNTAGYGKVMTDAEMDSQGLARGRMNVGEMMNAFVSRGLIPANKGAVAFNGGGFFVSGIWDPDTPYYDRRSSSWIVVNNGVLTRRRIAEDDAPIDTIIGITGNGTLKYYGSGSAGPARRQEIYNQIMKDKVTNTWAFNPLLVENGQDVSGGGIEKAQRNAICQVNTNNYIMYSSANGSATFGQVASVFKNLGCRIGYNLDGGGSTSLFYKVNSPTVHQVKCGANPCRGVIEGIYFTEK